ncbi:CARDB domain-containing protein [Intrasporangium flavum]|uniref:CARDB domain-containing protein n=1 Tax=Intrasporangium flavum TaxID=1428657 RepID=UPI00096E921D|nr:CARDB domain-containing protein [Intrasporangium flavum]
MTTLAALLAVVGTAWPASAEDGTPDLGVTITWGAPGGPHVRSGETATWTVTVTNLGDATAPAAEVLASGSDQFGRFTSDCGDQFCVIGDLAPGQSRTVTFSATACLIQAGGPPARRLWWVTASAWTATDPNPANNVASLDVRITGSANASCFPA